MLLLFKTNKTSIFSHSSPFRVKEDDEVDNLEIKFSPRGKSKRVYQSPPPEVGQKISRSLKVKFHINFHDTLCSPCGIVTDQRYGFVESECQDRTI